MFLGILQNSQENNCARVPYFTKVAGLTPGNLLKKRLWHRCLRIGTGTFKNTFWQNTSGGCFYRTSPRRLIYIPFISCVGRDNKLFYFYLRLLKFSDLKKKAKRGGKMIFLASWASLNLPTDISRNWASILKKIWQLLTMLLNMTGLTMNGERSRASLSTRLKSF